MDSSPFIDKPADPRIEAESLKFQLRDVQTQLSIERLEHEDMANALRKQLEHCESAKDERSRDQIFYYNAHKELQARLANEQEEFQRQRNKYEQDLTALKQQVGKYRDKSEEVHTLNSQLSQLIQDKAMLQGSLQQEKVASEELLAEVSQCHEQLTEVKSELQRRDEVITQLRNTDTPSEADITNARLVSKQLSEQVGYIQELEHKNLQQSESLKQQQLHKINVEIIKNENRALHQRLKSVESLQDELDRTNLELLKLKQEHSKWSVYLGDDDAQVEDLLKSYKSSRDENLIMKHNLDKNVLELKSLQGKYNDLFIQNESNKQKSTSIELKLDNVQRINRELEQQRDLAFEESQYLRTQLTNLDTELSLNENDRTDYIKNLETLIDEYKAKLDDMTKTITIEPSNKRPRPEDSRLELETVQSLQVTNRELETQLSHLMNENALLIKKLEFIEDIKEQQVRILQLRNNPFLTDQVVKREQLEVLQKANEELLGQRTGDTIPKGVYDQQRLEVESLNAQLESLQKKNQRLSSTFQKKSMELMESIYALFGYKFSYVNGKIKLVSKYADGSLLIDPREMTFKRTGSGGFVQKCDELIGYWIQEKGEISCFLGALTLELYGNV